MYKIYKNKKQNFLFPTWKVKSVEEDKLQKFGKFALGSYFLLVDKL